MPPRPRPSCGAYPSPPRIPRACLLSLPNPPPPTPGSRDLLVVSWSFMDISYKRDRTICSLLHLVFALHHNFFEVRPCCSTNRQFVPLFCWVSAPCMEIMRFVHASINWRAFGLSPFGPFWVRLLRKFVYDLLFRPLFISLGYVRTGNPGVYGKLTCNF